MAAVVNERDKQLQNTSPRLIATSVAISANGASFLKQKNGGAIIPSSILLEAVTTVFTSPTITWHYAISSTPGTWISLGTGTTKTITNSDFVTAIGSNSNSIMYRAVATQSGFLSSQNFFTITYSKEADDPIEVVISRTATSVPCDSLSAPTGVFDNTGTTIKVRRGTSFLTYGTSGANTFSVNGTPTITPAAGVTLGAGSSSGDTYTRANITAMSSSIGVQVVTVVYEITVRDASGSTAAVLEATQTFTKTLSEAGEDGQDAYHIRLDNESRIALCEYDGTVIAGVFPMTIQAYVTKGASDITVGSGFITYSIQSTSGTLGSSINSSGVITITGITLDTNYTEIKAIIAEPGFPTITAYKKVFIYKLKSGTNEVDITVTASHGGFTYANNTDTTATSSHTITFTATIVGIVPEPTCSWETKAYDSSGVELSPGGAAQLTINGNIATMTSTQFGARGNPTTRYVRVIASYNTGTSIIRDEVSVYRLDGTGEYAIDTTNNPFFSYLASSDTNTVSSGELNSETCNLRVIYLPTLSYVTAGWSFTAVVTATATVDISGSGAGPFVATSDIDTIIKLATLGSTTTSGTITITATKATFPTLTARIDFNVNLPASNGIVMFFDPDPIIIPVDINGNILSYSTAFSYAKILNGSVDDTNNGWTFSKVDGPGVTSTLTS